MHDNLAVAMGGRVAEEIIFGHDAVTSGAASDIQYATGLARSMVTQWGMSDKLGPLQYAANEEEVFLGHSVAKQQNMSDETSKMIDDEIKAFVSGANDRATKILNDNIDDLHALAKALLEYETLSGDEIDALLKGEPIKIKPKKPDNTPKAPPRRTSAVPTTGVGQGEPQPEG